LNRQGTKGKEEVKKSVFLGVYPWAKPFPREREKKRKAENGERKIRTILLNLFNS